MVKGGLRSEPSSGTVCARNLQRLPCLSFSKQKELGTVAFPSHSALLPCAFHSTLPESILIVSAKPSRLPPTLSKKCSQFQFIPRWPWSDPHMSLFSNSALANLHFNEDGGLEPTFVYLQWDLRGATELPFEGAGSRWAFYQGAQSIWNLKSGKARGFLSTLRCKVRILPRPSSLQFWCNLTVQPSDPVDLSISLGS